VSALAACPSDTARSEKFRADPTGWVGGRDLRRPRAGLKGGRRGSGTAELDMTHGNAMCDGHTAMLRRP